MTDWVSSTGGPLILVEQRLALSWRGIDGLSVQCFGASNDYERACQATKTFTDLIQLRGGNTALLLGFEAMDTIARVKQDQLLLLRVAASEVDFDGDKVLNELDPSFFSKPDQIVEWSVSSSPLALFDSSCPGNDMDAPCIVPISAGAYRVLTRYLETDDYWIAVHRFDTIT